MFRQATEAGPAWNLAKTLTQILVFWSVFLLILPYAIWALEAALGVPALRFAYQREIGAGFLALFSALGLWSGITMTWFGRGTPLPVDAPRELVTRGPYAYLRNPMAVAGLGQAIAIGTYVGSVSIVVYALLGGIVWHRFVRPLEEADLQRRFGASYAAYRSMVPCWTPRIRRDARGDPLCDDKEI